MLTREENFYDKVWVELWSDLTQLGVYESMEAAGQSVFRDLQQRSDITGYTLCETPHGLVKLRISCSNGVQILIMDIFLGDFVQNFL